MPAQRGVGRIAGTQLRRCSNRGGALQDAGSSGALRRAWPRRRWWGRSSRRVRAVLRLHMRHVNTVWLQAGGEDPQQVCTVSKPELCRCDDQSTLFASFISSASEWKLTLLLAAVACRMRDDRLL